jgi:hypothetical protein
VPIRATLAALGTALLLLALPSAATAYVPPGFFGMAPQGPTDESDYQLMEEAGVRSVRLPLYWDRAQPFRRNIRHPEWAPFDREVELAAEHGINVFFFLFSSPRWAEPEPQIEPVDRPWKRRAWATFLREAVARYGPEGSFWAEHEEELPYDPVRTWEVWDEENIVTFGLADPESFATLIRISGRAIHRADPGAKVILGGLFGRPLQIPPNVGSGAFLKGVYEAGDVKPYFDGVALHPYVAVVRGMRVEIENLRRIMRENHDGATRFYLTELGWGSASYESRWERGPYGQARQLNEAFAMLANHRRSWRIGGAWWFSWADIYGACQFCDSAGLLTRQREAKPAWYRFTEWTGGDPYIVPRASSAE